MKKHAIILTAVTALVCLSAGSALAAPTSFGIRGGFTDDLDTIFFGGHIDIYPSSVPQLVLEPSLELGIPYDDDDEFFDFTLRLNFHVKYLFPIGGQDMVLYPLVGPSLLYIALDDRFFEDDSDTELGVNLGGGFGIGRFAIELAVGLGDTNDITLTGLFHF